MAQHLLRRLKYLGLFALLAAGSVGSADAADLALVPRVAAVGDCSTVRLVCDNGHIVPICPIALSVAGEIVTATMRPSPGHSVYVRLVPMGVGYRYAGKGIWLDGLHTEASLIVGERGAKACTVEGVL